MKNNCLFCETLCKRKYCSKQCYWKNKHDAPWNKETKGLTKPNITSFKKGAILKRKNANNWKIVSCFICKTNFKTVFSRLKEGKGKYCSRVCSVKGRKGFIPWNKNIVYTIDQKSKLNLIGLKKGHGWNYKGDKVGYYALHAWVARHLGKASVCLYCGSTKNVQWANISWEYKRDLNDYMQMCFLCHRQYDRANWGAASRRFSL